MPSPFSVRSQTNPGTDLGEWDTSGNIKIPGTLRAGALSGPVTSDIIALTLAGNATTSDIITIKLPFEGYPRMVVNADGKMEWSGGSAAVDTNLYRQIAGTIITDGTFYAASGLKVGYGAVPYMVVSSIGAMEFSDGTNAADTNFYRSAQYVLATNSNFAIRSAGSGLMVKEGANATMGVATLNAATGVVVSTTKVTATSRIFLTVQDEAGTASGNVWVSSRIAGTSFTVKTTALNTSTVAWWIVEPSA